MGSSYVPPIATPVSIANGGTGEATAAAALTALGAQPLIQEAVVTTTESTANFNSTTYADSTALQFTLGVGTYFIEWRGIVSDSSVATSGTKCRHNFSGTGTLSGLGMIGNQAAGDPPAFPDYLGINAGSVSATTGEWSIGGVGQDFIRTVQLVVTVQGLFSVQKAQATATSSALKLYVGSYLKITKTA